MLALTMALIDNDDDKELFRQMFNKYKKRIFSVAYHFLSSEALAEEATQETFFRLAKNFCAVRQLEGDALEGYIIITAKHTAIGTYRREKKHTYVALRDGAELADSDFSAFERADIRAAIESLGPNDREVLYLYYSLGLGHREAGKALGISAAAARKRAQYARARLRKQLEGGDRK